MFIFLILCGCGLNNNTEISTLDRSSSPKYLKTAIAFTGLNENDDRKVLKELMKVDPVNVEWCAAFVNSILRVNDIPGSESVNNNPLLARSFLDWGSSVENPKIGDIVVFPRGNQGWQGHVGIYILTKVENDIEYYLILGGNQGDEVSYEYYPASSKLDVRRWID